MLVFCARIIFINIRRSENMPRLEEKYTIDPPKKLRQEITSPEAKELWNTVMRKKRDQNGKIVQNMPNTASERLAQKIKFYMNDPSHIYEKFCDVPPKAKELYTEARFSKSKWGRIMGGTLPDIERGNAFAIAVVLRLNVEQTEDLLRSAGFCLNYELDLDAAIMYFIEREIYDMNRIYEILGEFCDCTPDNGLDCFIFEPRTEDQMRKPKTPENK